MIDFKYKKQQSNPFTKDCYEFIFNEFTGKIVISDSKHRSGYFETTTIINTPHGKYQ